MNDTEDFLKLVEALYTNDTPSIIALAQKASVEVLQALVDVGDSMKRIAHSEAENREIHLFTEFKTMLLIPKKEMDDGTEN
jgi:hypothetical protein